MPSNAMLTMSTVPPGGFVINPSRPFPMPLKNPSTPSSWAPVGQNIRRQTLKCNLKTHVKRLKCQNFQIRLAQTTIEDLPRFLYPAKKRDSRGILANRECNDHSNTSMLPFYDKCLVFQNMLEHQTCGTI